MSNGGGKMTEKRRLVIGCTEPSAFQQNVLETIEKFYGANPIKLCQNRPDDLEYWLSHCDAVILAGGADIHPRTYGSAVLNEYNFSKFDVQRDVREIRIIQHCLLRNIPMLGICRGHQLLGVFHGLKFIPDLTDGPVCHQPKSQNISSGKDEPMHWVMLSAGVEKEFEAREETADLFFGNSRDARYLWVNSFHHQGLQHERKPQDLRILGTAPGVEKDQKIIEFMMGATARWISCQWHPEYDWESNAASSMVLTRFKEMVEGKSKTPSSR
jgi:putative glutamine amidotransferase